MELSEIATITGLPISTVKTHLYRALATIRARHNNATHQGRPMTLHLTHEQLCDLILADSSLSHEDELHNESSDSDIVHTHLQACLICSAELREPA